MTIKRIIWNIPPPIRFGLAGIAILTVIMLTLRIACADPFKEGLACRFVDTLVRYASYPSGVISSKIVVHLADVLKVRRLGPEFVIAPRGFDTLVFAVRLVFLSANWFILGTLVWAAAHLTRTVFRVQVARK